MIVIPFINQEDTLQISDSRENLPELECPFCHTMVRPVFRYALFPKDKVYGYGKRLVASFPCCNGTYFVKCDITMNSSEGGVLLFNLKVEDLSLTHPSGDIPEAVQDISPTFVTIYNEARTAHNHGLTQIVGGGYRKALEFLIRDYAIKLDPKQESSIRGMQIGTCISQYLSHDSDLRAAADRVSWLGNDEVHFTKEWKDKDIDDMHFLLRCVIDRIYKDERLRKEVSDMPRHETKHR